MFGMERRGRTLDLSRGETTVNRMTRPRSSLRRKLLLALAVLATGAAMLETAVRVRQYRRSGDFGRPHAFVDDEASGLPIPRPGRTGSVRTDSHGFRSPEVEDPKPEGRVRLAFLGGSTTFCAEASGNKATWPHLVWKSLSEAFPNADLDYLNASAGGYAIDSSLVRLEQHVRPLAPDVLFIYHATNDLTKDTRALAEAQGVYSGHGEPDDFLTRWSLAWYLVKKNLQWSRIQADTEESGRLTFDPQALSAGFRQRLTELVERSQELAPVVVLITFSQRTRPEQSPEERRESSTSSRFYMPYMTPDGLITAFEEYNRVIREVAAATGALLVEGEDRIPADAIHFADSVHFFDPGCREMAARVVEVIEGDDSLRALLER